MDRANCWGRGHGPAAAVLHAFGLSAIGESQRRALRLISFATILLVALVTSLAFAHVLESPAKMRYEAHLYITLQKSLYVQWGPPQLGGFLEPAAIAATAFLVFFSRNRRRWFGLAALLLLLLAFPVVFFWLVAPANAGFAGAALPSIPPDWIALRSSWETGHALRFALQFAALGLLVWPLAFGSDARTGQDTNP